MFKKNILLSLILALCLCLALAAPAWAADDDGLSGDNDPEGIDLNLLITSILNGDIQPINEAGDNVVIDIINNSSEQLNDNNIMTVNDNPVDVNTKNQIVDIRKIDNNENSSEETYAATVIFTNEYKFNENNSIMPLIEEYEQGKLCDVTMACTVVYEKLAIEDKTLGQMYGYKIKSVTGTYVSTSDPQMRCKSLYVMVASAGIAYESATSLPIEGTVDPIVGPTINSPVKGLGYKTSINQQYYYCNDLLYSANAGSTYFTVARYNSDYTADSFIQISVLPKKGV